MFQRIPGEKWKKLFDKAKRNGLDGARHGGNPYTYNPAKVANWLHRKGEYQPAQLARIIGDNFPHHSIEHRESFLDYRRLLDEN